MEAWLPYPLEFSVSVIRPPDILYTELIRDIQIREISKDQFNDWKKLLFSDVVVLHDQDDWILSGREPSLVPLRRKHLLPES